jgi:hypothetical protein
MFYKNKNNFQKKKNFVETRIFFFRYVKNTLRKFTFQN